MRSIIFTSLTAGILAGAAMAQGGGPPFGCYHRDYTAAHLASHPDQVVDWISLRVYRDEHDQHVAAMRVMTADQGHVAASGHGGQIFDQWLICWDDGGEQGCSVECDGGSFTVTRDGGDAMTIRLRSLWVGDTEECGGAIDIAEIPGQSVSYRLNRVDDAICEGY